LTHYGLSSRTWGREKKGTNGEKSGLRKLGNVVQSTLVGGRGRAYSTRSVYFEGEGTIESDLEIIDCNCLLRGALEKEGGPRKLVFHNIDPKRICREERNCFLFKNENTGSQKIVHLKGKRA